MLSYPNLNGGLLKRAFFQIFQFDAELKKKKTDILFSITGDFPGSFKPVVGISQNMLLYERDIWKEIKSIKEVTRFWINFKKQQHSFKNSEGIIFISNYAKEYISNILNISSKNISVINHGISPRFKGIVKEQKAISKYSKDQPFKILYVSTVHVYKHQWNVVKAVHQLRQKGLPIVLNMVGGIIFKPAGEKMAEVIKEVDPKNEFINYVGDQPYEEIDKFYRDADTIVFASTCENMPNILIESMASGVPVACSNKQPMPEFLKDNGVYFDSYDVTSIAQALETLIMDTNLRKKIAENNLVETGKYSWKKAFDLTFKFLLENEKRYNAG
jgi:glycosyltransferase involved in cell wall biosynthesis